MSLYKLQKIKKYLNENLFKSFIILSKALYFSLVLFALKVNEDLRLCVNYWKLNVIIKRNRYSLFLIKKVINKIISYKHLTRLNIILAFNKLRIHFNNEDYTIFIIVLNAYKLRVLFFKLINDSVSF